MLNYELSSEEFLIEYIFRRFSINNKHTLDWLAIQPILPISGAVHLLDLVPPGS